MSKLAQFKVVPGETDTDTAKRPAQRRRQRHSDSPMKRPKELSGEVATRDDYMFMVKSWRVRPEAAQMFEILKAELGRTGISLIAEALNDLYEKHGKPRIA